jgi:uracil-DNA glycosylase
VQPQLIVALGATAARSLMGRQVAIGKVRGEVFALADGTQLIVTIHPSALLRIQEETDKREAYTAFVKDLKVAARTVFRKAA